MEQLIESIAKLDNHEYISCYKLSLLIGEYDSIIKLIKILNNKEGE